MLRKKQSSGSGTVRDPKIRKLNSATGGEPRSFKPALACQLDILRHGTFSDVTFVVGERKERVPCHQLFLRIRSPVFEVMFSERWNQDTPKEIPLEDVEPEIFKKFLEFIYADSFDADVPEALELLQLAHKYDVQLLAQKCEKLLKYEVTLDDAVPVFQAARKYGKEKLMDKIGDMLAESLSELETLPFFNQQLDKETLIYILKRDDLEMKEVDVFRLTLQWARNQTETTVEESLEDILPHVRFPTMTLNEFATTVVPTKLLSPSAVVELVTYFGTNDKAKKRVLARALGFSVQQRQPKDLTEYKKIYLDDNGNNTTRRQTFESLKECLQFHESMLYLRRLGIQPEDLILGIGISGITIHCPAQTSTIAESETSFPSFKTFKISLKSNYCPYVYDFIPNYYYTELLNISAVEVEVGKRTDVRFDTVIPLNKRTMYCITVEEITTAEGEGTVESYDAEDLGEGPNELFIVTIKKRARTALCVQRNKMEGFWDDESEHARPQLICRLGFQKLL